MSLLHCRSAISRGARKLAADFAELQSEGEEFLMNELLQATVDPAAYRLSYDACPICGQDRSTFLCEADCQGHPLWHPPLPSLLRWLLCASCGHVFTDSFYSEAGLREVLRESNPGQVAGGDPDLQRMVWSSVVERVLRALPDRSAVFGATPMKWLDVGCGGGGLVLTAAEYGFAATGLDLRAEAVRAIQELGGSAIQTDLLAIAEHNRFQVISMADVLEHMPYPVGALRHAHTLLEKQGVLFISCPNRDCSSWRSMDARGVNIYWREIEHYHNFSRKSLVWLLRQCGFEPVSYAVSTRYKACMEIVAIRAEPS